MNSIFKTFVVSLLMIAQVHFAYGQNAAILPPAKTTFFDQNGNPLTSGTIDFYIPGTTTRKTTWQDAAATIANTNPVVLDSAGRGLILGNGAYRQVVKDRNANVIWDQVTNSAGAGGGSGQTTVGDGLAVGTVLPWSGFVAPNNYAYTYGQELSRTTYVALMTAITLTQSITCVSGNATLTTIADTTQLNIGAAVEAACVPAGATILSKTATTVTISANASVSTTTSAVFFPWGNGNGLTTFNAPDLRGVVLPGRNNMGGSSSANLTVSFYTDPNSLAGRGGSQSSTILLSNVPNGITAAGTATGIGLPGSTIPVVAVGAGADTSFTPSGAGTHIPTTGGGWSFNNNTLSGTTSSISNNTGGIAISATVAAGGAGYSAGTQLLTVSGGTCTTQPQFNVTVVAGAITAPVLVTAGQCSVIPANPAATTGGGGAGGTLTVSYSAVPFSQIQPSKTINYIVKILPDVSLGVATCGNLTNAGTACTFNVGTSGATIPLLNSINSWSALQNFSSVAISGGSFTGLSSPVNPTDAATKAYVDSVASGLNILATSALATAAVLPNTPTYANGAAGVGATLTAGSNTTLTVDGTAAPLNTVVLVKNQASAFQNGIYTVTQAGSGAAPWILTRATYFDQAAEMKAGSYTFITSGVTNLGSSFVLQTAVTTVGTDPLNWILFTQSTGANVVGSGTSTAGDLPIITNTTSTAISGAGYNATQVPGLLPTSSTVTITNASPGIVSWAAHGLTVGNTIYFCNSGGALPTGLTACIPAGGAVSPNTYTQNPTLYYVCGGVTLLTNSFAVATTMANAKAGTCVNTSSAGSGTHTAFANAMACAGCVGEYIYSRVAAVSTGLTTATDKNWANISLTQGVWEVGGTSGVFGGAGTTFTHMHASINYGIGTSISSSPFNGTVAAHITSNNSNGWAFTNNPEQVFFTTTTQVNSTMQVDFSGGTAGAYGELWARRIK